MTPKAAPRLERAEFARSHFLLHVDPDVTDDDLLTPSYWSSVAQGLRVNDLVTVRRAGQDLEYRVAEHHGEGVQLTPIGTPAPADEPQARDHFVIARVSADTPHVYGAWRRASANEFVSAWAGASNLEVMVRSFLQRLKGNPASWPNLDIANQAIDAMKFYPMSAQPVPGDTGVNCYGGGVTLFAPSGDPGNPDLWHVAGVYTQTARLEPQKPLRAASIVDEILNGIFWDGPDKIVGRDPKWKEWHAGTRGELVVIRPGWSWAEIAPKPAKPVEDGEDPGEWNPFAGRPWTSAELEYADMRTPEYQRALKAREINKKGKKRKAEQSRIQHQQGRVFDTKRRSWYAPE